ncbi:MAG: GGDEF domain-containing protein [Xanthomonadaceae bacterium]|nr:GGDEF domain-containing protein [Xanthomonadaceae bacterium]MDE1962509.1 GGDEF domain-containing protein [Xanthomonadaceae bacterium]
MEAFPATPNASDVLAQLERSRAQWSRLDALLRRLVTRLTYAADGRRPPLDASLATIRRQVRDPIDEAGLERLLSELGEAIKALDETASPTPRDPAPLPFTESMSVGQVLLSLVDRLKLGDEALERLESLRETIAGSTDPATLALQAEAVATLVNRHFQKLGEARDAAERLLTHVTQQLEELAVYLAREDMSHRDGASAREQLDQEVLGEIRELASEVAGARELGTLQAQVQTRLGAISTHLKSFRQREEAREREWQARTEQMGQRIRELERTTQAMEASLRHEQALASTDPLTGVANRLVFEQHIAEACLRAARSGARSSLLVLDIDRFKQINDSFGHAAGDRALRIVAEQLRAGLRSDDLLARYGGEEFVVILAGVGGEAALRAAESLRRRIESLGFHGQQRPVRITLSCGVTVLRPDDTPETAFERADGALYKAKRGGRNRCELA